MIFNTNRIPKTLEHSSSSLKGEKYIFMNVKNDFKELR